MQYMDRRTSPLARVVDLAEEQAGLLTRRQALNRGISPRTLNRLTLAGGPLGKVAHGVYRLRGAPPADHEALRAAWLRLAPELAVWDRTEDQGVVSHRSAAEMYGIGHLPEERHEFTIGARHQTRRADVRLHRRALKDTEWIMLRGLPVSRPSRIASDLLYDAEDPAAVAQIISESLRGVFDYPSTVAEALAPHAAKFGLRRGDGVGLLRWMLELTGDPEIDFWLSEAQSNISEHAGRERGPGNRRRVSAAVSRYATPGDFRAALEERLSGWRAMAHGATANCAGCSRMTGSLSGSTCRTASGW